METTEGEEEKQRVAVPGVGGTLIMPCVRSPAVLLTLVCWLLLGGTFHRGGAEAAAPSVLSSSYNATTLSQQVFQAVQYLSPMPQTWSPNTPIDQWGDGIVIGSCLYSSPIANVSLYFNATLMDSFTVNRTLRVDLLNSSTPLCGIHLESALAAAPMTVVVNFTALPTSLQSFRIPGHNLVSLSGSSNNKAVNLTQIPDALKDIDLSNCGAQGPIDLTKAQGINAGAASVTFFANLSANPGIIGAVDVVQQALCGYFPFNILQFTIDLRGTSIALVVAAEGISGGATCISNANGRPGGLPISLYVNENVSSLPVNNDPFTFLVDYGYYCLPASESSTRVPMLNYLYWYGQNVVRVLNPPFECFQVITSRSATYDIGYIYDSPILSALSPCLPETTLYATIASGVAYSIALHDAVNPTPAVYGRCPNAISDMGDVSYYSYSMSKDVFVDFINTGLNVTSRGVNAQSGIFAECFFAWPCVVQITAAPNENLVIYNDEQLIHDLLPCLPTEQPNGEPYGVWQHANMIPSQMSLNFLDSKGNTLTLNRYSYALVFSGVTYCLTTPTSAFSWNVTQFASTLTVTGSDGVVQSQCTFSGALQYQTLGNGATVNTFNYFAALIAALGRCLPPSASGGVRSWSASLSHVALQQGSEIFGDLVLVDETTGDTFVFSNSTCATYLPPATYCSNVDLFTGTLLVQVSSSRFLTVTHYQSDSGGFRNVTSCEVPSVPLLFDPFGNAFFLSEISAAVATCLPQLSNTAVFGSTLAGVSWSAQSGTVGLISSTSSVVELTIAACSVVAISPNSVTYCPPLPTEDDAFTSTEECIGSLCRPYRSLIWQDASSSGRKSWTNGVELLTSPIYLSKLAKIQNISAGSIDFCFPTCFVETSDCRQIAFVMTALLVCYTSRGVLPSSAPLPLIPAACQASPVIQALLQLSSSVSNGAVTGVSAFEQSLGVQCLTDSTVALVIPSSSGENFVLIRSDGGSSNVYQNLSLGGTTSSSGLAATCSTCYSIWLQTLYPTPLILIAVNAGVNMLLVIVANYIVQPLAGPQLIRLKVRLLVAIGALARRERKSYETWLRRCLNPYIAAKDEIQYHVDAVCKVVNAERKKLLLQVAADDPEDETDEELNDHDDGKGLGSAPLDGDAGEGVVHSTMPPSYYTPRGSSTSTSTSPPPPPPPHPLSVNNLSRHERSGSASGGTERRGRMLMGAASPKSVRSSTARSSAFRQRKESVAEKSAADQRFREVYQDNLMCGVRMLESVGEISLRKLVELRDACSDRPSALVRTSFVRFPTHKQRDTFITEMTAENLLRSVTLDDDNHNNNNSNELDYGALPNESSLTSLNNDDMRLEDAIHSVDTDNTAVWVPFMLAQDWMDRQFLSPKDWLLCLQTLYVVYIFGRSLDAAVTVSGATTPWEYYTALYFYFFSSSSAVALIVNAVFRQLYAKNISADATGDQGTFATAGARLRVLLRDPFFMTPTLLLLPGVFTHVVAGMVLFPFVPLVAFLIARCSAALVVTLPEIDALAGGQLKRCSARTIASIVTRIIFRQAVMIAAVATPQFAYNYAVMAYLWNSPAGRSWPGIIETDYNSRSVTCMLEQLEQASKVAWSMFYAQLS